MKRSTGLAVATVGVALLACGKHYDEYETPKAHEPHATLKIRVVYHRSDGPALKQRAYLDEKVFGLKPAAPLGQASNTPLYVHPGPSWLAFVLQYYYMRSSSRSVTGADGTTRTETDQVYTPLATCNIGTWLPAEPNQTYLVQVNYMGPHNCSVTCKHQIRTESGESRFLPCRLPPAAKPASRRTINGPQRGTSVGRCRSRAGKCASRRTIDGPQRGTSVGRCRSRAGKCNRRATAAPP